jgi:hypothetical protein
MLLNDGVVLPWPSLFTLFFFLFDACRFVFLCEEKNFCFWRSPVWALPRSPTDMSSSGCMMQSFAGIQIICPLDRAAMSLSSHHLVFHVRSCNKQHGEISPDYTSCSFYSDTDLFPPPNLSSLAIL